MEKTVQTGKHKGKNKLLITLSALLLIGLLLLLCWNLRKRPEDTPTGTVLVKYFYSSICESCDPEAEFTEEWNSALGDLQKQGEYQIVGYNTVKDETSLPQAMKSLGLEGVLPDLPVLIVGNSIISNKDNWGQRMPAVFHKEILRDKQVSDYYSKKECPHCVEIADFIAEQEAKGAIIDYISADEKYQADRFKAILKKEQVPKDSWVVPFIYTEKGYLAGSEDIRNNFENWYKKVSE